MASVPDLEMVRLASTQHGAIHHRQLRHDVGLSRSSITRRVRIGALRVVSRGVYVVTAIESRHSVLSAALLLAPDGVVSHRSAAELYGMALRAATPTILVPQGTHRVVEGVLVHETRRLPADDRAVVNGLAVTTPERTLCDLAAELAPRHLYDLIQEQAVVGRPTLPKLVACHESLARRGRNGTVVMRTLLADLIDGQPFPQSKLELVMKHAFTERRVNYLRRQFAPPWYNGIEGIVDFADPGGRTIIEGDGRPWHTIDRDRRRDAHRDREAARHGWLVLRVGWTEIVHRTDSTMDELLEILEFRRATAA